MVKVSSTEGWISIGPWGGRQGNGWAYKPTEGFVIKQIIIRHGCAVDSIVFGSEAADGSVKFSDRFGGPGGTRTDNGMEAMEVLSLRDPGPWGGPGGNQWDDGVFAAVQKVHLYVGHGSIHAIQLEYMKRNRETILSPIRGSPCGELIEMDFAAEVLVGIEGYCGPVEEEDGTAAVAITSISLYTNRGKYGPFGVGNSNEEGRSYFVSGLSGKVVGFFGRSGTCLNAVGLHVEYPDCL